MKKFLFLFLLAGFAGTTNSQTLNVLTFNIRLNTRADSLNAWPYRKDKVASQILFHEADIVGVQEALYNQMVDLQSSLAGYKYVGGGRDDGKKKGEFSAIFYDTTKLQVLKNNTFWLSLQPEVPGSKSWDAAITRIVTWAHFRDKKTGRKFYAFNTHFDHKGKIARKESAKLLLEKINEIAGADPLILTGDFNTTPKDEPIQLLVSATDPKHLTDTKTISKTPHYGPDGTFNGFKEKEQTEEPIDYIFVRNIKTVLKHATLSQSWQGRFSSDHFPVFATIKFK